VFVCVLLHLLHAAHRFRVTTIGSPENSYFIHPHPGLFLIFSMNLFPFLSCEFCSIAERTIRKTTFDKEFKRNHEKLEVEGAGTLQHTFFASAVSYGTPEARIGRQKAYRAGITWLSCGKKKALFLFSLFLVLSCTLALSLLMGAIS